MWRGYLTMRRDLDRVIERQLADVGLSSADYELLVPLSEAPDQVLRARDLGLTVGWDRSRLAHHLRRMEQRGLVTRFECPTDARGTMVGLTTEGRSALQSAAPGHVETVRRFFVDVLTPQEVSALAEMCERVRARIGAGEGTAPRCDDDPVDEVAVSPTP